MRTTIDIDDAVLARALARFPPGTPKTVIIEEGLRRLDAVAATAPGHRNPVLNRLILDGRARAATGRTGVPREALPPLVPLEHLLRDLEADRADR